MYQLSTTQIPLEPTLPLIPVAHCTAGKLYCGSCHQQGHAIIPARVLHKWDFTPQPVCCAAADYLASIYEQPVLCVAAINPGLYTR